MENSELQGILVILEQIRFASKNNNTFIGNI